MLKCLFASGVFTTFHGFGSFSHLFRGLVVLKITITKVLKLLSVIANYTSTRILISEKEKICPRLFRILLCCSSFTNSVDL